MSTKIDYLDETWNPITGCSGKGCKAHCWARKMVKRFPFTLHGHECFQAVNFHPVRLYEPLHWRKPRRVGVCFMGDLFDEQVPTDWIYEVFQIMKRCPHHTFFLLTKQPDKMRRMIMGVVTGWDTEHRKHIWQGVSVTDQEDADRMIPELLKVLGKKWVSIEPMLGPVNLTDYLPVETIGGVEFESWPSWLVLGCESGQQRRPCPHEWMIDVVRQCKAAGVPVWVKQVDMGKRVSHKPEEWPEELRRREK